MKYDLIRENAGKIAVEKMCATLEVSPSGYYQWLKHPQSNRDKENQNLLFSSASQSRG